VALAIIVWALTSLFSGAGVTNEQPIPGGPAVTNKVPDRKPSGSLSPAPAIELQRPVSAGRGGPPAPAPATAPKSASTEVPPVKQPAPQRIKIAGPSPQLKILRQTRPVYPLLAKEAWVQGQVILDAIISKDGTIQRLQVVHGHPLLAPAALDAVKHWVYQPVLVKGQPVEVETQIIVDFNLTHGDH